MNRKKNLDLVLCTPAQSGKLIDGGFHELRSQLEIVLTKEEEELLAQLPVLGAKPVGRVLVAVEAKACMTEHLKARPRLYDELSSSFQTILGDTQDAIAAGFVTVNVATEFSSPLRNSLPLDNPEVTAKVTGHDQPRVAKLVVEKVMELPRRSSEDGIGFDAIGVSYLDCKNDGTPVVLVRKLSDGEQVNPILSYSSMIERISGIYSSRFRRL